MGVQQTGERFGQIGALDALLGNQEPCEHGLVGLPTDARRGSEVETVCGIVAELHDRRPTWARDLPSGGTRRAVLTHSPTLHAAQARGFDQTLAKTRRRLADLQAKLARGNTRRHRPAVEAEIAAICKPRWVGQVITTSLTGDTPAHFRLSWRTDARARDRLQQRVFNQRRPELPLGRGTSRVENRTRLGARVRSAPRCIRAVRLPARDLAGVALPVPSRRSTASRDTRGSHGRAGAGRGPR